MDKEYLKSAEVAEILGVCRSTVLKLIKSGRLAVAGGMKSNLIRRSDIDRLFEFKKQESAKEVAQ